MQHHNLAQKTGLSEPTLHKILKGGADLKLSTIGKIEKALGVELVKVTGCEGCEEELNKIRIIKLTTPRENLKKQDHDY